MKALGACVRYRVYFEFPSHNLPPRLMASVSCANHGLKDPKPTGHLLLAEIHHCHNRSLIRIAKC